MISVIAAAAVSLFVALFGTPLYIRFLVKRGYGQFIRDDGPTGHATKRGTPTMGGAVIIAATLLGYLAGHLGTGWTSPSPSALLVLGLMLGLGLVGLAAFREWRALGFMLALGAAVCFADGVIVAGSSGRTSAIAFHLTSGVYCGALAWAALRRAG